jgi:hypothetical protein
VGDGIGILPGQGIKQKKLQRLDLSEAIKSFFAKTLLQTLAMSVVNGHKFQLLYDFSCYFRSFWYNGIKRTLSKSAVQRIGISAHPMTQGGTTWNRQKLFLPCWITWNDRRSLSGTAGSAG